MPEVPLIVTEEAAAHVAKLGLQRELEQNLDWVRRNVPDLHGIRVELSVYRGHNGERPLVFIHPHHRDPGGPPYHFFELDWAAWLILALPPEALSVFRLSPAYHPLPNKAA
jgi:hypothetical protein